MARRSAPCAPSSLASIACSPSAAAPRSANISSTAALGETGHFHPHLPQAFPSSSEQMPNLTSVQSWVKAVGAHGRDQTEARRGSSVPAVRRLPSAYRGAGQARMARGCGASPAGVKTAR